MDINIIVWGNDEYKCNECIDYILSLKYDDADDINLYTIMKIDLLVTYNLAGFEQCTLTDGLSYNLLDCRQLHIIEKENLPNERFLEKEKSINMFFCRLV